MSGRSSKAIRRINARFAQFGARGMPLREMKRTWADLSQEERAASQRRVAPKGKDQARALIARVRGT